MKYNIISTGSKGNAVVLNGYILIDCGVTFSALKKIYKDLKIVLLTHEHGDHFKTSTIKRLASERPALRFACCEWLKDKLISAGVKVKNIDVLTVGKLYDYGKFSVAPVKLYHDVPNCGWRVFCGDDRAIYATDTGHLNGITAKDYDLYLIEANYTDEELKARIEAKRAAGEYCYEYRVVDSHLSKEQADEFIFSNARTKSQFVYLHEHERKGVEALCLPEE